MAQSILVVDDESDLRELIAHHLKSAGYSVREARSGAGGLDSILSEPPDAVILDVMLPDLSGTEVLKRLRSVPETAKLPVILLTARGEEIDRVLGFELGADDYVVKPFSPRELVLRVRALFRRAPDSGGEPVLAAGGLRIDTERHEARFGADTLPLTPLEFRLLHYLMQRPGRVISRAQLLDNVWDPGVFVTDRSVDTHVKRLRSKLGEAAELLETVRGVGYRFRG